MILDCCGRPNDFSCFSMTPWIWPTMHRQSKVASEREKVITLFDWSHRPSAVWGGMACQWYSHLIHGPWHPVPLVIATMTYHTHAFNVFGKILKLAWELESNPTGFGWLWYFVVLCPCQGSRLNLTLWSHSSYFTCKQRQITDDDGSGSETGFC